jgi:hypothetical protein
LERFVISDLDDDWNCGKAYPASDRYERKLLCVVVVKAGLR